MDKARLLQEIRKYNPLFQLWQRRHRLQLLRRSRDTASTKALVWWCCCWTGQPPGDWSPQQKETSWDCKINSKGRKVWLSNREGTRNYLFSAAFLCPDSMVPLLLLNQGSGQPTSKRSSLQTSAGGDPHASSSTGGSGSVLSAFTFHSNIWRWSMFGVLLLSAFLVFLPNQSNQRTQKKEKEVRKSYFTTSGVTENSRKHC